MDQTDGPVGIARLDPPGCGCTDCITGYSRPLNAATEQEIDDLLCGRLADATGVDWDDVHQQMRAAARTARQAAIAEYTRRRWL